MSDTITLSVCQDCYLYAGGVLEIPGVDIKDTPQYQAHVRVMHDNHVGREKVVFCGGNWYEPEDVDYDLDAGTDPHFSYDRCEWCLSPLGGDRYPADLLILHDKEN